MAYYGSSFFSDDDGEFYRNPYSTSYDIVPDQGSATYSSYEFNVPKFIGYNPSSYDSFVPQSEIHYSTYSFTEPKFIEYSQTQYTISYSSSEFNEIEFVEYDPTPYDGGYDPTVTYGKPLPPSDEICYPRSTSEPNASLVNGFSYASIPSPYGKDDEDSMKPNGGQKADESQEGQKADESEEMQRHGGDGGDWPKTGNEEEGKIGKTLDLDNGKEREGYNTGYDYGYECERQVQMPYGYGLEAMDICESVFGYWPCLYKKDQKCNGYEENGSSYNNNNQPWKGAADYLFGSPYGGGYYGDYYQQQERADYRKDKYEENSWMDKFNIF